MLATKLINPIVTSSSTNVKPKRLTRLDAWFECFMIGS
jgi:hypothetical protein